jgi:hypothetical protein
MAASAGAARPLAGLWLEQASVARMGWEEPGAEAVEVLAEAAPGLVFGSGGKGSGVGGYGCGVRVGPVIGLPAGALINADLKMKKWAIPQ